MVHHGFLATGCGRREKRCGFLRSRFSAVPDLIDFHAAAGPQKIGNLLNCTGAIFRKPALRIYLLRFSFAMLHEIDLHCVALPVVNAQQASFGRARSSLPSLSPELAR